jgi:hypothetical protein
VYYTRAVSGRIQQLRASTLLAGVIMSTAAASQAALDGAAAWTQAVRASSIDTPTASRVERFVAGAEARAITRNTEGQPPLEMITIAAPQAAQTLIDAAGQSADRLSTWLGPLPGNRLTSVDVPAHARLAGAAYPGIAITSSRLLATRREFAAERALTVAIARQYALAFAKAPQSDSWFAEGLAGYFATRAVHESFEGRYYLTLRYFGGYVPHSIRAIVMSPNPLDPRPRVARLPDVVEPVEAPWRLAHGAALDRANRLTMALHTLERFVGWPAFQATLRAFVEQSAGRTPVLQDLTAVLSEQRGADMAWFFDQAMRVDARIDYAVVNLASVAAASAGWETTVDVRRLGEATFDGTSVPRATGAAPSLPLLVRFADGSEITEWIDGRDREWRFEYLSASPAVLASVDPNAILLIDADRTNNTRTLDPPLHIVGLRLAFNWLAWLQDAMLACTAVI